MCGSMCERKFNSRECYQVGLRSDAYVQTRTEHQEINRSQKPELTILTMRDAAHVWF